MEIRFANSALRWVFLLVVLLVAATLVMVGGKNWLAENWAESTRPEDWLRAAELEPGNAEHWYRLGRYRQLDFENSELKLAISYYRRAVALDPRSATYWLDLAGAYEMAGEPARAREAFEAARAAYPLSAEVAWRYGNFLLRQGEVPRAFAEVRRALSGDPNLAALAVSRCWRASRDVERILDLAVPAEPDAYLAMLDFLVSEHETDAALAVWKRLLALKPSLPLKRAFPLLDELTRWDRTEEARLVWQQALGMAGQAPPDDPPGSSLIWDGGVERDFTNGGFGWRQEEVAGATFEFDTETRHGGARSLRVTFDGTANLDFHGLTQFVPVEPGRRYRFSAYLRTEEISTDSGIRFHVFDPRRGGEVSYLGPGLVGTQPWTLQEFEVVAGPRTHLLLVVLRRVPSRKFDNKIRGTVWVDDVSLSAVPAEAERRSP